MRTVGPPVVVSVGGLDPSGGAGILADVRAISRAGAWGCGVAACLTVQSGRGVSRVEAVDAKLTHAQLVALADDVTIAAIKTGALGSAANASAVESFVARRSLPAVVDPVMRPGTGKPIELQGGASHDALVALARHATVLTPNAPEAAAMLGTPIEHAAEAREAARALLCLTRAHSVLLKGGHLRGERAIDWLVTGTSITKLSRRRVAVEARGTGCTLASLIAGRLAVMGAGRHPSDDTLVAAVRWATGSLSKMLSRARQIGDRQVLGAPGAP